MGQKPSRSRSAGYTRVATCDSNHTRTENTEDALACRGVPNWKKDFPVVGQGTLIFSIQRHSPFFIVIRPKLDPPQPGADQWISLEVYEKLARFKICQDNQVTVLKTVEGTVNNELVGYETDRKISYWLSYDRSRLVLKYGKGYRMEETTLMTYYFLRPDGQEVKNPEEVREKMKYLFSPMIRRVIEQYDVESKQEMIKDYSKRMQRPGFRGAAYQTTVLQTSCSDAEESKKLTLARSVLDIEGEVAFDRAPLVSNWSPFVLDSSKVSLLDLDSNRYTLSTNLPQACQELYENVSPEHVDLNWPPTPDDLMLTDAIRYSINTKGMCLYEKLKEKQGEFGPSSPTNQVYLRVTLGPYRGTSPGIPYVLEIWPKDCGSPIHNHGNSYAVIKVLHGGLTISIFNKHADIKEAIPIRTFDVHKGDLTWISPNWYQTHMLWNHTDDYCATIQCYQYSENDDCQWPYFDYVSSSNVIEEFLPNSDFTYREMKEKVMAEYRSQ